MKKGYHLPRAQMENADIARIINSTEVQSVLRPKMDAPKSFEVKKNALKNKAVMEQLNPYAPEAKAAHKSSADVENKRKERLQASREHNKKHKRGDDTFYRKLMKAFEAKAKDSEEKDVEAEEDE